MPGRMNFRTKLVAFHVTKSVKKALRKQAMLDNKSVSSWLWELVLKTLKEKGHDVSDID